MGIDGGRDIGRPRAARATQELGRNHLDHVRHPGVLGLDVGVRIHGGFAEDQLTEHVHRVERG
jgi:hypothetical protein